MATVEVAGARLWYELAGAGEVVMQVPGAVSAHEGYGLVTPAMVGHFTVLDYDPRGYGLSDRPRQEYSFDVWCDDTAYGTGSRELAVELCNKAVSRAYLDGPNGGEALVEAVMGVAGRNVDADVFCAACDAMIETDLTADVAMVQAPTLVIVGLADVLTPAEQGPSGGGGRWIYENLAADAEREYLPVPESGHANLMDAADVCNPAVIDFLKRVESGR